MVSTHYLGDGGRQEAHNDNFCVTYFVHDPCLYTMRHCSPCMCYVEYKFRCLLCRNEANHTW